MQRKETDTNSDEQTIRQYQSLSADYDSRYANFINAVTKKILKTTEPLPMRARVLDIGCGTGEVLLALIKKYPSIKELAGVDISKEMLARAGDKLSAHMQVASLKVGGGDMLPYGDDNFDLIVSSGVLHYIGDPTKIVKEIARVLRAEGRVILIDVYKRSPLAKLSSVFKKLLDPGAKRFHSAEDIAMLLTKNGLNVKTPEVFSGGYPGLRLYIVEAARPS